MPDPSTTSDVTHVAYGDVLGDRVRDALDPSGDVVVIREALRDGPLAPGPVPDLRAWVDVRAAHLAAEHGADREAAAAELRAAWSRVRSAQADVVLHVDHDPCVDCSSFLAAAIALLADAGRAVARSRTGVWIARGGAVDPAVWVELAPADVAAAAGAWRLLVSGDRDGLVLASADLEGRGGMRGAPELPGLLARRAQGDVSLVEVHP